MATELERTRPVAPRSRAVVASVAVVVIASAASFAGSAGATSAQGGADPVTSAPVTSTTIAPVTTAPGAGGSVPTSTPVVPDAPGGSTTTTTVAVPPSLPPEYEGTPLAEHLVDPGESDGLNDDSVQSGFDPGSVTIRPDLVAAAAAQLRQAELALAALQADLAVRRSDLGSAESRLGQLDNAVRSSVSRAAAARAKLADHAVRAYVVGDVDQRLAFVKTEDFTDVGVARRYAGALGTSTERLVREYRSESARLSDEHNALATQLATLRVAVAEAESGLQPAAEAVFDAKAQLAAYEAGAHAYVKGFSFPIAGRSDFIDSWGFPRSGGRWHQGADIFAAHGTPLIATENGVLKKVGTAGLGGLRLWLVGESGNEYYYAHLAGFASGIADGRQVKAGEVVGFVGDTGNARGTPPHLHFEIHPGGVGPVNPYPLLRAAYDARPQLGPSVPTPAPGGLIAPLGG